eukprot:jgi/Ulvmu1/2483/UM137_0009.1
MLAAVMFDEGFAVGTMLTPPAQLGQCPLPAQLDGLIFSGSHTRSQPHRICATAQHGGSLSMLGYVPQQPRSPQQPPADPMRLTMGHLSPCTHLAHVALQLAPA